MGKNTHHAADSADVNEKEICDKKSFVDYFGSWVLLSFVDEVFFHVLVMLERK